VISVRIRELQGLDSNFAPREIPGITPRVLIYLQDGDAKYTDLIEQDTDLDTLLAILKRGREQIAEMLQEKEMETKP
jgi:hypothetical protein